ncbi:Six-hairpin glycosidase [Dacryopinax primogenitus]|uniref:Six-hairpin glycosidase n=1 Tax=Dacryopinax primogenitus (strain DJM 731) TaxID=1858805 RepID=M5GH48_DACPD|nr:Six-hairpin glycosidase [Dacryopinax primogenitus]EJU06613.1 Six-hairpin glycosidase [Dacryopinax primogenitus]
MFPSLSLLLLPLLLTTTLAQNLTDNQISQVRSNLQQSAQQSWELGTEAEALTELDYPSLSVFSPLSLPPPTFFTSSPPSEVLSIAASVVHSRPAGPGPLIPADGAVGDPASIGVSVLLANYSHTPGGNFSAAAQAQLDYLLLAAPRSSSGAISHRADQVQLWADFVYMAPPFIAYYGAVTQNQTLLALAYEQISLYRQALRDSSGLWRHITLGSGVDDGHWATGNGWAAAGCLRVAMTIYFSGFGGEMGNEVNDLVAWAGEIVNAVWPYQQPNGTLLNYVDDPSSFADSSSTALLASVSFRLATLPSSLRSFHTIPSALRAQTLINSAGLSTDGWLQPVVDPYDYPLRGTKSPEGQAFVLLLQAAYSEWSAQGEQGESAARAVVGSGGVGWGNVVGLLIALLVGVC